MRRMAVDKPMPLDHLVLPTAQLVTARARLGALGFTVAPDGVHPFGTRNCCVYLADGTFLEPLAVDDASRIAEAEAAGNTFVLRNSLFRDTAGQEGFSALALTTADALAADIRYRRAGLSAGELLTFSRPFVDATGRTDTASFRLGFAAPQDSPAAFCFATERVNSPAVDRTTLQHHANGALRVLSIAAISPQASKFAVFLAEAASSKAETQSEGGYWVALANTKIAVAQVGSGDPFVADHPRFVGVSFGVEDLGRTATVLDGASIPYSHVGARLVVAQAAGQGATFTFEELS